MALLLYLIPIIVFGLISIYTDMKKSIIKNHLIIAMLVTAAALHAYQLIFLPELQTFLPNLMINLGFSLMVGILLWIAQIWPAGDAKLFIAYSTLLPPELFTPGNHFLSFEFLINTFVPVFFAMFIFLMFTSKRSEIKKSLKFTFNPYTMFMVILVLLGFMWFIIRAISFIGIFMNYFIMVILLFVIIEIFNKLIPINMEYVYVFLAALRLVIDYRAVFTFGYVYELVVIIFAYIVLRYFIIDLGFYGFTVPKKIEDLKPGMCLAEGIAESKQGGVNFEKRRLLFFSILQALMERGKVKYIHNISFEGLSQEDVEKIKKLRKDGKIPFDEVMVHVNTPFAVFLFVGIILTVTLQTNFILYLKNLL